MLYSLAGCAVTSCPGETHRHGYNKGWKTYNKQKESDQMGVTEACQQNNILQCELHGSHYLNNKQQSKSM